MSAATSAGGRGAHAQHRPGGGYDKVFAERMTVVFEHGLKSARRYTCQVRDKRPLKEKLSGRSVPPLESPL